MVHISLVGEMNNMGKYYNGPTVSELRSTTTKEEDEKRKKLASYVEDKIREAATEGKTEIRLDATDLYPFSINNIDWLRDELVEAGYTTSVWYEGTLNSKIGVYNKRSTYSISWESKHKSN
jgi:TRAP-type mannitol/chloroaromatic compound transport system substrate-binding protein